MYNAGREGRGGGWRGRQPNKKRGRKRQNNDQQRSALGAMDLEGKVSEQEASHRDGWGGGGSGGYALGDSTNRTTADARHHPFVPASASREGRRPLESPSAAGACSGGIYGARASASVVVLQRTRLFDTPSTRGRGGANANAANDAASTRTGNSRSGFRSEASASRFTRAGSTPSSRLPGSGGGAAVHVVCAISENLARETCVASVDAGAPTTLHVTKQGNGQAYAETISYLRMLKPDEVLLNEGRRNSQLARKVLELYSAGGGPHDNYFNGSCSEPNDRYLLPGDGPTRKKSHHRRRSRRWRRHFDDENGETPFRYDCDDIDEGEEEGHTGEGSEDRFGPCRTSTVVKFVSRSCFDQTRGAALLRKISREETYDPSVVEEYILLSSAHAVVNYLQNALGATFAKSSVYLSINVGGNNRMAIDRTSLWQLEILVNSKTGKGRNSLIGTIDYTKTTVGSRLLRTNLMSPPTRTDTIHSRLELVDTFLGSADFFHTVMEHLVRLPDVDRMLSNIALVPRRATGGGNSKACATDDPQEKHVRLASKGIAALVSVKTVLSALPSLANTLQSRLAELEASGGGGGGGDLTTQHYHAEDTTTAMMSADRSSLLIGLGNGGGGGQQRHLGSLQRHHLLRAIIEVLSKPALSEVIRLVTEVFMDSTTYDRNANAMRHQECFALKDNEEGILSVLRKAYLSNVDDIYKKADEYAELHSMHVNVRYTSSRGYFLSVPASHASDLPEEFLHPTKSGRTITCTTKEISSLNMRARDNVRDLLVIPHERIQEVLDSVRLRYDALACLCDAIALLGA